MLGKSNLDHRRGLDARKDILCVYCVFRRFYACSSKCNGILKEQLICCWSAKINVKCKKNCKTAEYIFVKPLDVHKFSHDLWSYINIFSWWTQSILSSRQVFFINHKPWKNSLILSDFFFTFLYKPSCGTAIFGSISYFVSLTLHARKI